MIKVLIESPYAGRGDNAEKDREKNLEYLRAAMRDCFMRGEAPFASHGLYTQPGVLDDDVPDERSLGIEAGLVWGQQAEKTVVYTDRGVSTGMRYGIENALKSGRRVEVRTLAEWRTPNTLDNAEQVLKMMSAKILEGE